MAAVISIDRIRESLDELVGLRIHPTFPGYLCILRTSVWESRTENLRPDFDSFFRTFFAIPSSLANTKPYYRPFMHEHKSGLTDPKLWLNPNVAGSFASSSLRGVSPFRQVVDIRNESTGSQYSLRENHERLAREHLVYDEFLPVVPLAAFLFRDYGLEVNSPALSHLVDAFKIEFGFAESQAFTFDFDDLFVDDSPDRFDQDWFNLS